MFSAAIKVMFFICSFFWAESNYANGNGHTNESGNKHRESYMGNKDGKAGHGDKQTVAVKTVGLDTA